MAMRVVGGVDALTRDLGPAFVVVGVFDGLHRGHALPAPPARPPERRRAARRPPSSRSTTTPMRSSSGRRHHFSSTRPSASSASRPPASTSPSSSTSTRPCATPRTTRSSPRIRRPGANAGRLPHDPRCRVRPRPPGDPHDPRRAGVPQPGFEVEVVPPFTLDGRPVRSTEIRSAIASGELAAARRLLGRAITLSGHWSTAASRSSCRWRCPRWDLRGTHRGDGRDGRAGRRARPPAGRFAAAGHAGDCSAPHVRGIVRPCRTGSNSPSSMSGAWRTVESPAIAGSSSSSNPVDGFTERQPGLRVAAAAEYGRRDMPPTQDDLFLVR